MLPDRVSNPKPLTYESGALPIALHGQASSRYECFIAKISGIDYVVIYGNNSMIFFIFTIKNKNKGCTEYLNNLVFISSLFIILQLGKKRNIREGLFS